MALGYRKFARLSKPRDGSQQTRKFHNKFNAFHTSPAFR